MKLEQIVNLGKKFLGTSLLAGALAVSPFLSGCSENNQESKLAKKENTSSVEKVITQEEMRKYFPLAIGNEWTYKRTVSQGKKPLFWFVYEVEKPRPLNQYWDARIDHPKGSWASYVGNAVDIESGTETYKIVKKTDQVGEYKKLDAFEVTVSDKARDGRYELQKLEGVYWRYTESGFVWEVIRGFHLGEGILVNGYIAFLKLNEELEEVSERKRRISCKRSEEINVPAGRFKHCIENTIKSLGGVEEEEFTTIDYFAKDVGLAKEVQYNSKGEMTYKLELIDYNVK